MEQFSVQEAENTLASLLKRALAGEEIVIAEDGQPKIRLTPLKETFPAKRPGGMKGRIVIRDDFDAPLPPDLLGSFGNGRA